MKLPYFKLESPTTRADVEKFYPNGDKSLIVKHLLIESCHE